MFFLYVCAWHLFRPEDHCGRPNPVCEEAVGRDDPYRLLPERLCPHWPAAVHGKPAPEVRGLADQHDRDPPQRL